MAWMDRGVGVGAVSVEQINHPPPEVGGNDCTATEWITSTG